MTPDTPYLREKNPIKKSPKTTSFTPKIAYFGGNIVFAGFYTL